MAHQAATLAMEKLEAVLASFGADDLAGEDTQPSGRLQLSDTRCDLGRAAMTMHVPPWPQMAQKAALLIQWEPPPRIWRARTQTVNRVLPRLAALGDEAHFTPENVQRIAEF